MLGFLCTLGLSSMLNYKMIQIAQQIYEPKEGKKIKPLHQDL